MKGVATSFMAATCLCILGASEIEEKEYRIPDGKTVPPPQKISDDQIRIGSITVNHKQKTISFPAFVNMNQGLIEYIAAMPHGKLHETLLVTEADPLHLSVGMRLLKYPPYENFFPKRDADMQWLPYTPPQPEAYAPSLVRVTVTWKNNGADKTVDISELIVNTRTRDKLPANQWLYTGSYFYAGRYQASLTGDLIAIFADPSSPINYIGDFNQGDNESGWLADPDKTPPPGTQVTVEISRPPSPDTTGNK